MRIDIMFRLFECIIELLFFVIRVILAVADWAHTFFAVHAIVIVFCLVVLAESLPLNIIQFQKFFKESNTSIPLLLDYFFADRTLRISYLRNTRHAQDCISIFRAHHDLFRNLLEADYTFCNINNRLFSIVVDTVLFARLMNDSSVD